MFLADATPQVPTGIPEWLAALLSGNLSLGAALIFIWWKWLQPLLERIAVRHLTFLDNIEKAQENMLQTISIFPQLAQNIQLKIDALQNDVKRIRPRPDSDSIPISQPAK